MKTKFVLVISSLILAFSLTGFTVLTSANYKESYATSSNNLYKSICFNPIVSFMNSTPNALVGNTYSTLMPGATLTHIVDLKNRNTNVPYTVNLLMTANSFYDQNSTFLFRSGTPLYVTAEIYQSDNTTPVAGTYQQFAFNSVSSSQSNVSFNFNNVALPGGANTVYKLHINYVWPNSDQLFTTVTRYSGSMDNGVTVPSQLDTTPADLHDAGVCAFSYTNDDLFQHNGASMIYQVTFTQAN